MAPLVKSRRHVFHQAALRITHCAAEPRLAMDVMVQATFDYSSFAFGTMLKKSSRHHQPRLRMVKNFDVRATKPVQQSDTLWRCKGV